MYRVLFMSKYGFIFAAAKDGTTDMAHYNMCGEIRGSLPICEIFYI